jgi:UrcA family protein
MLKTLSVAAAAMAIVVAVPASARDVSQGHGQITVTYSDLDVTHPEGAAALRARIEIAARRVCGPAPEFTDFRRQDMYAACVKGSIDRAMAQFHSQIASDATRDASVAIRVAQNR